jgi:hypothetical protein
MTNRSEVYVEGEWKQDRYVSHFVLRALNPANLAKFYREIYELQEMEKPADDPSHYLTDGRVTIIVSPWAITDYEGAGIEPRHMDHLGFRVEDVESFKKDLQDLVKRNPALAPKPGGTEGDIRLKLLAKCKHGQFQLADPDGVPIDVAAGR